MKVKTWFYFDNLQITHDKGPITQETHYYPFGLTMAGISSKAMGGMETVYKFNAGTELDNDLGIAIYETAFRMYDPQIGRFAQVDPMVDSYADWSPYSFAFDDPVFWNDPLGAEPDPYLQKLIDQLIESGYGGAITRDQDGDWVSSVYGNLDAGFFAGSQYAAYYNMWGMFPGMASTFDDALEKYNGGFITANMAASYYTAT